jgi:lipoprotein-anchoring transpeptidase ErfK/SrfK
MANKIKKSIEIFLTLVIILAGVLGLVYGIQARYQIVKTEVNLEKISDVVPDEAVAVDFSFPIISNGYVSGIKIIPAAAVNFHWENNKKLVITPQKFWKPETDYKIILPQGTTIILSRLNESQRGFSTAKYPRVSNIFPGVGVKDVLLDAESPIIVDFNKSTKGFFIKFVLDPDSPVLYQPNPEKTEFKLLPKDAIKDGQSYDLKMYAKWASADDADYVRIFQSNFKTFSVENVVWEKDFNLRLEQAKKYTRAKITSGKYIDVSLATQVMVTFQDGKLLDAYLISSGKPGMPTPPGTYKIENKAPRAWSKEFGLFMPNWMALVPDGKFGIHELPEWPGGYKEGANHLGTPVSHGCVRLGVGPAKTVYDWAEIGTPVIVY